MAEFRKGSQESEPSSIAGDTEENLALLKARLANVNEKALSRFLRAYGSVEKAYAGLDNYLKWRLDFGVDFISDKQPEILNELKSGKATLLDEKDYNSRPIILVTPRLHSSRNRNADSLTKFIVYLLESAAVRCNEEVCDNFCILFDMKGFSIHSIDYQFTKNMIWLLTNYYPERLGVWLIVNPPIFFSTCWIIMRNWLDEITAKKVVFVTSENQLKEYLPLDILPRKLFR
uniref:CRAL-TRIO domain-containing protein n=1 Tax=Latimeria chalumnae TaxID=7897 RepID=H3A3Z3_LATCH|nr:PREDICTED: CRAL-TRIO domain-containing protein C589.09, mitochondrial-like isoform X2 [Latimeria chalumnae]|eukprot:XP_014350984.1 PREDICTED: CRAL-TRIO domain-containing protein C589.09, mitochondrial-like isoform X2 [Latimeria chalumnae]